MVQSHLAANHALACGIHAVPDCGSSFAATQAGFRFLGNPRVTLRQLSAPLIEAGRREVQTACDQFVLVAHDWSQLMYPTHSAKADRVPLSSKGVPEGYEWQSALLVRDRDGTPLTPLAMSVRAADGLHCSRSWQVREPLSPLDALDPVMTFAEASALGRPCMHLVDAEADSVWHYRQWDQCGDRWFVVRADDRYVEHDGGELRCSTLCQPLHEEDRFANARGVLYHGRPAQQWVAEAAVRLIRPAQRNRPGSHDRRRIPGEPVSLRLVISEVRDEDDQLLARWYLLAKVPPQVDAATIALWYYWRWSIESFFKLLKSAGQQVEAWQQESAGAIARRLLVASMACVVVWHLARSEHPQATAARE